MKRTLTMLLAGLLLLSAVSCGAPAEDTDPAASADTSTVTPSAEEETEPETEPSPLDALNGMNFDGEAFRITYPAWFGGNMYDKHLAPEEETGEIMNDTSLRRYYAIEELLGVKFEYYPQADTTAIKEAAPTIMAGDDAYDMVQIGSAWENLISVIKQGALYNLLDLPHINLDAHYFYSDVNEMFVVNDQLYFAFSSYNNAGSLPLHMVFNKNMMNDMGMELPYDTIFSGDWTFDKFLTYVDGAATDLDGDGKMGLDDRYGYGNVTALTNYMVFGFEVAVVERGEDGAYVPALQNEKLISSIQKIVEFTTGHPDAFNNTSVNSDGGVHIFMRGDTLFSTSGTSALDLRSIEDFDFGIAPYPKYDENQKDYASYLALDQFSIPVTIGNPEKVGAVTEALAIVSEQEMKPAFLEVYVENKLLRDEESVRIAEMMMDNICMDVSRYYDFANGMITPVYLLNSIPDPTAVVSKLTSLEKSSNKMAGKFFEIFFD